MSFAATPADAPPSSHLVPAALLGAELDALHEASANMGLLCLLPAIQVAWADGRIQPEERRTLLELASEQGVADDPAAMQRLEAWLDAPPPDADVQRVLQELRSAAGRDGASDEELAQKMLGWAREVAQAEGGLLGFRSVSEDEHRALAWLEAALDPAQSSGWEQGAPSRRSRPTDAPRATHLAVMQDLLTERMAAVGDHVELVPKEADSMWPRPCPLHDDRMPPAVFGVPKEDYDEFMSKIVSRYVRTLTFGTRAALGVAARDAVSDIDDAEFARLVFETPFSRLLVSQIDPADERAFGDRVAQARSMGTPYKVDLSHYAHVPTVDGVHQSATVSLFALRGGALVPVAISVAGRVFGPSDGASWERARMFVLQGCSAALVVGVHASLHFPMDSVIAVSREVLPSRHPIARLVEAHAYLHLPLDYGVRFSPRSVAWNNQQEIYAPFASTGMGNFQSFSDYYAGIEGNSGYPSYRYPMASPDVPGPYGAFLGAYYDVVLSFCREVAARVDLEGSELAAWASALARLLPGFPDSDAIRDPEVLSRALAGFVHAVSVWHSTEHHAYAQVPVRKIPQRLRISPPIGNDPDVPRHQWVRPTDVFRQELARQMFYAAHTVRGLLEVEYGFSEPELVRAAGKFFDDLSACDRAQSHPFMPLDRMACSIQF